MRTRNDSLTLHLTAFVKGHFFTQQVLPSYQAWLQHRNEARVHPGLRVPQRDGLERALWIRQIPRSKPGPQETVILNRKIRKINGKNTFFIVEVCDIWANDISNDSVTIPKACEKRLMP